MANLDEIAPAIEHKVEIGKLRKQAMNVLIRTYKDRNIQETANTNEISFLGYIFAIFFLMNQNVPKRCAGFEAGKQMNDIPSIRSYQKWKQILDTLFNGVDKIGNIVDGNGADHHCGEFGSNDFFPFIFCCLMSKFFSR